MTQETNESTMTVISRIASGVPDLIRKEIQLLRAEMGEKLNQATTAVGLLAAAAIMALVALNVLAAALVAALAEAGLGGGWAALIVGAVIAIVALMMAKKGANDLKASSLTPNRTISSVRKDAEVARESVR